MSACLRLMCTLILLHSLSATKGQKLYHRGSNNHPYCPAQISLCLPSMSRPRVPSSSYQELWSLRISLHIIGSERLTTYQPRGTMTRSRASSMTNDGSRWGLKYCGCQIIYLIIYKITKEQKTSQPRFSFSFLLTQEKYSTDRPSVLGFSTPQLQTLPFCPWFLNTSGPAVVLLVTALVFNYGCNNRASQ